MPKKTPSKMSATASSLESAASEPMPIDLPKPALDSDMSLAKALRKRATTREIRDKKLPLKVLSNLLWAACGVNRKIGPFGIPGRTAASASNSQGIDVYLYDPVGHRLVPAASGDLRALAIGRGQSGMGADAPVRLIYVADIDRLVNTRGFQEPGLHDPDVQRSYSFVDTGLIAANVYLFAASAGLGAWFHNCDKEGLAAKLSLRPDQRDEPEIGYGMSLGMLRASREEIDQRFQQMNARW